MWIISYYQFRTQEKSYSILRAPKLLCINPFIMFASEIWNPSAGIPVDWRLICYYMPSDLGFSYIETSLERSNIWLWRLTTEEFVKYAEQSAQWKGNKWKQCNHVAFDPHEFRSWSLDPNRLIGGQVSQPWYKMGQKNIVSVNILSSKNSSWTRTGIRTLNSSQKTLTCFEGICSKLPATLRNSN